MSTSPFLKWGRLQKYCELSGDTPDAVHARRRKGEWIKDIQCRLAPDRHLWVNLREVEKWVERTHHVVMRRRYLPGMPFLRAKEKANGSMINTAN
jgi:hypothetical protein